MSRVVQLGEREVVVVVECFQVFALFDTSWALCVISSLIWMRWLYKGVDRIIRIVII